MTSPVRRSLAAAVAATAILGCAAAALVLTPAPAEVPPPTAAAAPEAEQPRIAFTDDRDSLQLAQFVDYGGELRSRRSWPVDADRGEVEHAGEASVADGEVVYVDTADEPHGEIYRIPAPSPTSPPSTSVTAERLTCNTAVESHPVLRDRSGGDLLAYASDVDGDWDVYVQVLPPDGGCGDPAQLYNITGADSSADDLWPTWTYDGDLVLSSTRSDAVGDLYRYPNLEMVDGVLAWDAAENLTDSPGVDDTQPAASTETESQWIAFTTTALRPDGSIAVLDLGDEGEVDLNPWASTTPVQSSEAAWTTSGYSIAFTTTQNDPYGDIADTANTDDGWEIDDTLAGAPGVAESHPAPVALDTNVDFNAAILFTSRTSPAGALTDDPTTDADISDTVASDGSLRRTIVDETGAVGPDEVPLDEAGPDYSTDGTRITYSESVEPDRLPQITPPPSGEETPHPPYPDPGDYYDRVIWVADADGTDPTSLADVTAHQAGDVDVDPVWSPDGTRVAFVRYRQFPAQDLYHLPEVWAADLDGSPIAARVSQGVACKLSADRDPDWSPDGRWLVVSRVRQDDPACGGEGEVPVFADPEPPASGLGGPDSLWLMDPTGTNPDVPLTFDSCSDECIHRIPGRSPQWSPDGSQIAFDLAGTLRLLDIDPDNPTPETDPEHPGAWRLAADDFHAVTGFQDEPDFPLGQEGDPTAARAVLSVTEDPTWSPDGSEIAFAGQPAGQPDQRGIWAVQPDGTGLRAVTDDRGPETEPTWQFRPVADLAVDVTTAVAGQTVTTTYAVSNLGPDPAVGVALTTVMSPAATGTATTAPPGCAADGSGCSLPTLAGGAGFSYVVDTPYAAGASGTATGTVAATTHDPVPDNNTDTAPFVVPPPPPDAKIPDLAVAVTIDDPVGYVGGLRSATVTVTNRGVVAATPRLRVRYPEVLAASTDPAADLPCLTRARLCTLPVLAPGASTTYDLPVLPTSRGSGDLVARVRPLPDETSLADNVDQATIDVQQPRIRLLPAVARPGMVVLAYGQRMPPGSRVRLTWSKGIIADPGPYDVEADGTMRASLLIIRRDVLGNRALVARSTTREFSPVRGRLLVVPRVLTPPEFETRG